MSPALASKKARFGASHRAMRSRVGTLAQLYAKHLIEPCLSDIQHEQRTGYDDIDPKLMHEALQVASSERVVKWLISSIQRDLAICGRADDNDESRPKPYQNAARP